MKTILVVLIVTNLAMLAMSASILDYLTDVVVDPIARDADAASSSVAGAGAGLAAAAGVETKRNCLCNGPSCICCVDFNMSFIDLGGPGCVRMNYISPEEGIAINVSYGDSLLHSQTVRGPDPAPTCLNIFARIAQMCARFSQLLPTDDGLRGCVILEPMLLGASQIELPIGCFKMGPNGMQITESNADIINEQIPGAGNVAPVAAGPTADNDDDDDDEDGEEEETGVAGAAGAGAAGTLAGYSTADILAVVSDSAEQGIALLTNWFGLATEAAAAAAAANAQPAAPNGTDVPEQAEQAESAEDTTSAMEEA